MPNALIQLLLLHHVKPICCWNKAKNDYSFVLMHLILSYTLAGTQHYITYTNSSFFVNTKSWILFPVKHKYSNNFGYTCGRLLKYYFLLPNDNFEGIT